MGHKTKPPPKNPPKPQLNWSTRHASNVLHRLLERNEAPYPALSRLTNQEIQAIQDALDALERNNG